MVLKKIGVVSDSNPRIRKYMLRQRLRTFIVLQRRSRLSSRFGGRSITVKESSSVRSISYQSFLEDNVVQSLHMEACCSRPIRSVPLLSSVGVQSNVCPIERSAFQSYFSTGTDIDYITSYLYNDGVLDADTGISSSVRPRPLDRLSDEYELCDFGAPTCACRYCGVIVWFEERNNKKSTIENATFNICLQFRKDIHPYNSIFAFTSIGARVDTTVNDGRGPYVYKLCGQNYHRLGTLLLPEGHRPKFAQIYFYDSENELSNRLNALSDEPHESALNSSVVS